MSLLEAFGRATAEQISEHLKQCDASFVPRLSSRVNLAEYGHKLVANAVRFEAWDDATLVGVVAVYRNDPAKQTAFVTSVSVLPEWRGRGIAGRLLDLAVADVRAASFAAIELEVDPSNASAVALYVGRGWKAVGPPDDGRRMRLSLR